MASIFSKIIAGEIPCYKVYEDDLTLAFLDINPVTRGHVLVIPKQETDYLFDLEDRLYAHLFPVVKKVSKAIESVVKCDRISVAVVGLEVPHAHVHLIPITEISDFSFSNPKAELSPEEFVSLASQISEKIKD